MLLKLRVYFKKYKSLFIAIVAIILFIILFLVTKRSASGKLFQSFRKNIDKYTKYNKQLDKDTFKKLEELEDKKKEMKEEIEKKYQNETNEVKKEINKKVKEELRKIEDDPKALSNWYNDFLNSNTFSSTTE